MYLEFKTDFFKRLQKVNRPSFMRRLVNRAGVVAVNFSKERFVQKNWVDRSREPWQKRARPAKGSLLVRSGRLKRSIRKLSEGEYFVYVGTDVPYAKIHNEGGTTNKTVTVRGHSRLRKGRTEKVKTHQRKMNLTVPKRQFLGDSAVLGRRIERQASKDLTDEITKL